MPNNRFERSRVVSSISEGGKSTIGSTAFVLAQRVPASNLIVMRTSIVALAILLTGCAANPRALCGALVPNSWTYLRQAPSAPAGLESSLPATPYRTNQGRLVSSVRRLWYEQGDDLMACTLDRCATDTCSVVATRFSRSSAGWVKVSDDAVLCHVLL
jgi:hypothetical protein